MKKMANLSTDKRRVFLIKLCVFALIEALLWVDILWGGVYVVAAQYASVVLAFAFSLLFSGKTPKRFLIQIGLFATCVADYFLVVSDPIAQSPAMSAFVITQIAYCALIVSFSGRFFNFVHLTIRSVACIAAEIVTALVLKDRFDYLSAVSMFYYANLIINATFSFILFKKLPIFAMGLLFFILCDTVIGLNVAVGTYIFIDETSFLFAISHSSFNWAWAFYLPSQVCIAVTAATLSAKN